MFISEKEIEIRYAETDQMGVVYHANLYIEKCFFIYMKKTYPNYLG